MQFNRDVSNRLDRFDTSNPAQFYMEYESRRAWVPTTFKIVEVDAEAEICGKMLHKFKTNGSLVYFQNVSNVAAYAKIKRKTDFMKMEEKMKKKGYIWENFVADLALIVNNALMLFQPKDFVYKAGIRLDKKVNASLGKFPRMIEHYRNLRSQIDEFMEDACIMSSLKDIQEGREGVSLPIEQDKSNDDGTKKRRGRPRKIKPEETKPDTAASHSEHTIDVSGVDQTQSKEEPVESEQAVPSTEEPSSKCESSKNFCVESEKDANLQEEDVSQVDVAIDKGNMEEVTPRVSIEREPQPESESNSVKCTEVDNSKKSWLNKEDTVGSSTEPKPSFSPSKSIEAKMKCNNGNKIGTSNNESPSTVSKSTDIKKDQMLLKISPIKFFVNDENSECMDLCRKIFEEIKEKPTFAVFQNLDSLKEFKATKTTDFAKIEEKMETSDYKWEDFLRDIAIIIDNSLSMYKPDYFVHKAALKLDSKMVSCLRSVNSMKQLYETLRNNPPSIPVERHQPPHIDQQHQHYPKPSSSSTSSIPTNSNATEIDTSKLQIKTDETVHCGAANLDKSNHPSASASADGKAQQSPTSNAKSVTTRTLEKDEIQQLCLNLFSDLKADETLISLKYLTKDSACQSFAKKTDLAKVERKLSRSGYIWGKFVKDLAAVAYIALNLYPKESSVFQAGVALDNKIQSTLRKFPVMHKKYVKTKTESNIEQPSVATSTPQKETSDNIFQRIPHLSISFIKTEAVEDCEANQIVKSPHTESKHTRKVDKTPKLETPQKKAKHCNGSLETFDFKLDRHKETSKNCAEKTQLSSMKKTPEKIHKDLKTNQPKAIASSNEVSTLPKINNASSAVGENPKEFCTSILRSLRDISMFSCFENVVKDNVNESLPDFSTIALKLQREDYTPIDFVEDLAGLVNITMQRFSGEDDELFSAVKRLDVRILSFLCSHSKLRDEYKNFRFKKSITVLPNADVADNTKKSPWSPKNISNSAKPIGSKVSSQNLPEKSCVKDSSKKSLASSSNKTFTNEAVDTKSLKEDVPKEEQHSICKDSFGKSAPVLEEISSEAKIESATNLPSASSKPVAIFQHFVEKIEVDEEDDICNTIFRDVRSKITFQVFENVSEVPNYAAVERRVDFMKMSERLSESGYIWAKFIADLATIVNNAIVSFDVSHKVHKIALKLDARMAALLQRLPIMKEHYDSIRSRPNCAIKEAAAAESCDRKRSHDAWLIESKSGEVAEAQSTANITLETSNSRKSVEDKHVSEKLLAHETPSKKSRASNHVRKLSSCSGVETPTKEKTPRKRKSPGSAKKERTPKFSETESTSNGNSIDVSKEFQRPVSLKLLRIETFTGANENNLSDTHLKAELNEHECLVENSEVTDSKNSDAEREIKDVEMRTSTEANVDVDSSCAIIEDEGSSIVDSPSVKVCIGASSQEVDMVPSPPLPSSLINTGATATNPDTSLSNHPDASSSLIALSALNDTKTEVESNAATADAVKEDSTSLTHVSTTCGSISPTKANRQTVKKTVVEEVDEEVDICNTIFLDIRTKSSYIFFENVSCVSLYEQVERKVDFTSIEKQLSNPGYIWEKFIGDMATIVNNALAVFNETHKAHKAATRLDQRMKHLMRNLPIMLAYYNKVREGRE